MKFLFRSITCFTILFWSVCWSSLAAEVAPDSGLPDVLKNVVALMKGNESAGARTNMHFTVIRSVSEAMKKRETEAGSAAVFHSLLDESELDVRWMQDGDKLFTTMVRGGKAFHNIYGAKFKGYSAGGVTQVFFEEVKGGIIDLTENVSQSRFTYNPWAGVLKNAKGEWWSDFLLANKCALAPATLPEMVKEDMVEISATRADGTLSTLVLKPSLSFVPVSVRRISNRQKLDQETRIEWANSASGPLLKRVEFADYFFESSDAWLKTILDVKEAGASTEELDRLAAGIFPDGTAVNDKITGLIFTTGSRPSK